MSLELQKNFLQFLWNYKNLRLSDFFGTINTLSDFFGTTQLCATHAIFGTTKRWACSFELQNLGRFLWNYTNLGDFFQNWAPARCSCSIFRAAEWRKQKIGQDRQIIRVQRPGNCVDDSRGNYQHASWDQQDTYRRIAAHRNVLRPMINRKGSYWERWTCTATTSTILIHCFGNISLSYMIRVFGGTKWSWVNREGPN